MPSPFYSTSARYALRQLLGSSNVSDVDAGFAALASDVENAFTGYRSGTSTARGSATALDGLLWRETDTGLLWLGTGTGWQQLTPSAGATNIATAETRSSVTYGLLTTPDQVTNVILPTNGLISVSYQAVWQESAFGAGRAAIFIGANQLRVATAGIVGTNPEAAATGSASTQAVNVPLASCPSGLVSTHNNGVNHPADATTGQAVGLTTSTAATSEWAQELSTTVYTASGSLMSVGGPCLIFAAAGTYTVSVQFKASSGSVTASNRKLWVRTLTFP